MNDRSLGWTGRTSTLVREIDCTDNPGERREEKRKRERDLRLRLQRVGKYKEGPRPPLAVSGQESKEQSAFLPYHFPSYICKFRCLVRPGPESPVSSPGCKRKVRPKRGSSNRLVSSRTRPHPHPRTSESEERETHLRHSHSNRLQEAPEASGGGHIRIPAAEVSVEHGPSPEAL